MCKIERNQMATCPCGTAILIAFAYICWCIIRKLNLSQDSPQNRFSARPFSIYDFRPSNAFERRSGHAGDGTSFQAINKSTENNFLHYATEWVRAHRVYASCSLQPLSAFTGNRSAVCLCILHGLSGRMVINFWFKMQHGCGNCNV